jgi:hypothetical protein
MNDVSSIGSIDDSNFEPSFPSPEKSQMWEQVGRISLASGLLSSAPAFFGSFQTKKRTATRPAARSELAETVALPNAEPPQPAASITNAKRLPYEQLHCTPDHQATVRLIINTVADGGIDLLWKKRFLDDLGEKIFPMHPYKFLSTILLDPHLRAQLKKIFAESLPFKRDGFLGGVKRGMEREAANLETYIQEFSAEMGTRPEEIRSLIQKGDWNGLVIHLLGQNPRIKN